METSLNFTGVKKEKEDKFITLLSNLKEVLFVNVCLLACLPNYAIFVEMIASDIIGCFKDEIEDLKAETIPSTPELRNVIFTALRSLTEFYQGTPHDPTCHSCMVSFGNSQDIVQHILRHHRTVKKALLETSKDEMEKLSMKTKPEEMKNKIFIDMRVVDFANGYPLLPLDILSADHKLHKLDVLLLLDNAYEKSLDMDRLVIVVDETER